MFFNNLATVKTWDFDQIIDTCVQFNCSLIVHDYNTDTVIFH